MTIGFREMYMIENKGNMFFEQLKRMGRWALPGIGGKTIKMGNPRHWLQARNYHLPFKCVVVRVNVALAPR